MHSVQAQICLWYACMYVHVCACVYTYTNNFISKVPLAYLVYKFFKLDMFLVRVEVAVSCQAH